MNDISDYSGFEDKPGQYFKYWYETKYTLDDGESEGNIEVVFYDFSREGADKQYEKLYHKPPTKFLRRENW